MAATTAERVEVVVYRGLAYATGRRRAGTTHVLIRTGIDRSPDRDRSGGDKRHCFTSRDHDIVDVKGPPDEHADVDRPGHDKRRNVDLRIRAIADNPTVRVDGRACRNQDIRLRHRRSHRRCQSIQRRESEASIIRARTSERAGDCRGAFPIRVANGRLIALAAGCPRTATTSFDRTIWRNDRADVFDSAGRPELAIRITERIRDVLAVGIDVALGDGLRPTPRQRETKKNQSNSIHAHPYHLGSSCRELLTKFAPTAATRRTDAEAKQITRRARPKLMNGEDVERCCDADRRVGRGRECSIDGAHQHPTKRTTTTCERLSLTGLAIARRGRTCRTGASMGTCARCPECRRAVEPAVGAQRTARTASATICGDQASDGNARGFDHKISTGAAAAARQPTTATHAHRTDDRDASERHQLDRTAAAATVGAVGTSRTSADEARKARLRVAWHARRPEHARHVNEGVPRSPNGRVPCTAPGVGAAHVAVLAGAWTG